jgi:ParB-like chromosome segregation protein Spo0J
MTADLKFHALAGIFPLMEGAEFDALVADIKANGLHYPIILYDGQILDGRNRYRACLAAGFEPAVRNGDNWIGDPASFVISRNIRRRHLTAEQKRGLITKLLKADPKKSDREIGRLTKADNKTVASVRAEQERREEIPHVSTRTDAKGRNQPATKPTKRPEAAEQPVRKPPKPDPRIIAPKLADRVGRFAHDLILSERLLARELADIIMLPGVRERLSADLTNGLALDAGIDAGPLRRRS